MGRLQTRGEADRLFLNLSHHTFSGHSPREDIVIDGESIATKTLEVKPSGTFVTIRLKTTKPCVITHIGAHKNIQIISPGPITLKDKSNHVRVDELSIRAKAIEIKTAVSCQRLSFDAKTAHITIRRDLQATQSLFLAAVTQLINRGVIYSDGLIGIVVKGIIKNYQSGKITAQKDFLLNAEQLVNNGEINTQGYGEYTLNKMTNHGNIILPNAFKFQCDLFDNVAGSQFIARYDGEDKKEPCKTRRVIKGYRNHGQTFTVDKNAIATVEHASCSFKDLRNVANGTLEFSACDIASDGIETQALSKTMLRDRTLVKNKGLVILRGDCLVQGESRLIGRHITTDSLFFIDGAECHAEILRSNSGQIKIVNNAHVKVRATWVAENPVKLWIVKSTLDCPQNKIQFSGALFFAAGAQLTFDDLIIEHDFYITDSIAKGNAFIAKSSDSCVKNSAFSLKYLTIHKKTHVHGSDIKTQRLTVLREGAFKALLSRLRISDKMTNLGKSRLSKTALRTFDLHNYEKLLIEEAVSFGVHRDFSSFQHSDTRLKKTVCHANRVDLQNSFLLSTAKIDANRTVMMRYGAKGHVKQAQITSGDTVIIDAWSKITGLSIEIIAKIANISGQIDLAEALSITADYIMIVDASICARDARLLAEKMIFTINSCIKTDTLVMNSGVLNLNWMSYLKGKRYFESKSFFTIDLLSLRRSMALNTNGMVSLNLASLNAPVVSLKRWRQLFRAQAALNACKMLLSTLFPSLRNTLDVSMNVAQVSYAVCKRIYDVASDPNKQWRDLLPFRELVDAPSLLHITNGLLSVKDNVLGVVLMPSVFDVFTEIKTLDKGIIVDNLKHVSLKPIVSAAANMLGTSISDNALVSINFGFNAGQNISQQGLFYINSGVDVAFQTINNQANWTFNTGVMLATSQNIDLGGFTNYGVLGNAYSATVQANQLTTAEGSYSLLRNAVIYADTERHNGHAYFYNVTHNAAQYQIDEQAILQNHNDRVIANTIKISGQETFSGLQAYTARQSLDMDAHSAIHAPAHQKEDVLALSSPDLRLAGRVDPGSLVLKFDTLNQGRYTLADILDEASELRQRVKVTQALSVVTNDDFDSPIPEQLSYDLSLEVKSARVSNVVTTEHDIAIKTTQGSIVFTSDVSAHQMILDSAKHIISTGHTVEGRVYLQLNVKGDLIGLPRAVALDGRELNDKALSVASVDALIDQLFKDETFAEKFRHHRSLFKGGEGLDEDHIGLFIEVEGKIYLDSSTFYSVYNGVIIANGDIVTNARIHDELVSIVKKHKGPFHYKKTYEEKHKGVIAKSSFESEKGGFYVRSRNGHVDMTGTDVLTHDDSTFSGKHGVKSTGVVAREWSIKKKSKVWGLVGSSRKSQDEYVEHNRLIQTEEDKVILFYSEEGNVEVKSVQVSNSNGILVLDGVNILIDARKLMHTMQYEQWGFRVQFSNIDIMRMNYPGAKESFDINKIIESKVLDIVKATDEKAILGKLKALGISVNSVKDVKKFLSQLNSLKTSDIFSVKVKFDPTIRIDYRRLKESLAYETVDDSFIDSKSVVLRAKDKVELSGVPILTGYLQVRGKEFDVNGKTLHSAVSKSEDGFNVRFNVVTKKVDGGVDHSSYQSTSDTVAQEKMIAGVVDIDVDTFHQQDSSITAGRIERLHVKQWDQESSVSREKHLQTGVSLDSTGDVSGTFAKGESKKVLEVTRFHTQGDITSENVQVGSYHSTAGSFTADGVNDFKPQSSKHTSVKEKETGISLNVSANVKELFHQQEGKKPTIPFAVKGNVTYQDAKVRPVVYGEQETHYEPQATSGKVVTDKRDGRRKHPKLTLPISVKGKITFSSSSTMPTPPASNKKPQEKSAPVILQYDQHQGMNDDDKKTSSVDSQQLEKDTMPKPRDETRANTIGPMNYGEGDRVEEEKMCYPYQFIPSVESLDEYITLVGSMEKISSFAYENADPAIHFSTNYELVDDYVNKGFGLHLVTYVSDEDGRAIIGIRGTTGRYQNLYDDRYISAGVVPLSYPVIKKHVEKIVKKYGDDYDIYFTGHSSGAVESALLSSDFNRMAIVFDNPGLPVKGNEYDFSNVYSFQASDNVVNTWGKNRQFDYGNVIKLPPIDTETLFKDPSFHQERYHTESVVTNVFHKVVDNSPFSSHQLFLMEKQLKQHFDDLKKQEDISTKNRFSFFETKKQTENSVTQQQCYAPSRYRGVQ